MTTDTKGTYLIADGSPVEMSDAKDAWAPLAREALLRTAASYNGLVHYNELADEVQAGSGIAARQLPHHWIGDVLALTSDECVRRNEPLLASLCVRKDGMIGDGYGNALAKYGRPVPDDLEMAAAEERLRCYEHFGATLPAEGGRPTLPREVSMRRRKAAKEARENVRKPVCPTCHLTLPSTGQCDNCA